MKILLFVLLVIPFQSFADNLPSCGVLEKAVAEMDRKLMSSNLGNSCNSVSAPSMLATDEAWLKLSKDNQDNSLADVNGTIEEFKCSNLSVIQANIKSLEGEIALLQGFEKLKADIRAQKEKTGKDLLPEAQKAGKDFTDGVVLAQSLELLFSEGTTPEIITALNASMAKDTPDQKENPIHFQAKVRTFCSAQPNKSSLGFCSENFNPSKETLPEIYSLISETLSTEKIAAFRTALAIKKTDDSVYSFSQLRADLKSALPKLGDGSELSKDELRAIRTLPDFKDVKIGNRNALKNANTDIKMHVLLEEFRFLSGDLKARQEFEVRSQVGIAWKALAKETHELSQEKRAVCDKAHSDFTSAVECHKSFGKVIETIEHQGSPKTTLIAMESSIGSTLNYLTNIDSIQKKCLTPAMLKEVKTSGKLTVDCEQLLPSIESQLSKKQNMVLGLNALKDKIGSENQRLITFRSYAMESIASQNCEEQKIAKNISNVGEFCPDDLDLKISKEAIILSSNLLGTLLFVKPVVETKIDDLCNDDKLLSYEQSFCDAIDKPVAVVRDEKAATASVFSKDDGDEEIGRGNTAVKDAWRQGTLNFASTLAGAFFPQPTQNPYAYMNQYPYPTNFTPYRPNPNIPSISDSLINMNSQYMGRMGSYHATPTSGYFSGYGR